MPRRKNGQSQQAIANETRRTRFERLGAARMNKAINSIRLLGNLSGPTYEWTPKDIDRIHDSLVACITDTLHRFDKIVKVQNSSFSFGHTDQGRSKAHKGHKENVKSA